MYLRHSTVKKNGKTHTYWRLVRSVRSGRKVRQETVAYLGELDAKGRVRATALARHFLGSGVHQPDLFGDHQDVPVAAVRTSEVRAERGRSFGDVWLGWILWRSLELDRFCEKFFPRGRERVPWADIAMILAIARLCEPSSELHIAEDWYRRTALEDLIGVPSESIHHRRLYEGLDRLLEHKTDLEVHLKDRLGTLFDLDYDLMLYDVTSTYFEGEAKANTLASRGYSRDKRFDCKQVCIGLVVSREGFPVGYEVFAGNRSDVTTVEEIVEKMEGRFGKARRIWVMDRGMTSAENLAWLNEGNRKYIVGTPRCELKQWENEIIDRRGWKEIREDIEVKLCNGPDGQETFILCRSASRQEKERAIHERFTLRIRTGLESLERRLIKARKKADRSQVERQIGRLLQRNSRSAAKFDIEVQEAPSRDSKLKVVWIEKPEWDQWAHLSEGTYILRSNIIDWDAEELWRLYIQLTEAEAAFRIQKSNLKIRPVWHQKAERTEAHILVCFLAYVMWKTLSGWQARAGLGSSPQTILEELHQIQSVDVVLPLTNGNEMRLRCVVRPDKSQEALIDRLGLTLPKRLRLPKCSANSSP